MKISSLKRKILRVGEKQTYGVFLCTRKQSTDKPSYDTLKETLVSLKESCKKLKINKIAFPKYECGLDKLQWCKVKTIINEVLINAGINCTVYLKTHKRDESEVDLSVTSKIKKLQRQDEFINNKIKDVEKRKEKNFVIEEGVLFKLRKSRKGHVFKQLVIPEALKGDIFKLCHDNFPGAHLGEKKT